MTLILINIMIATSLLGGIVITKDITIAKAISIVIIPLYIVLRLGEMSIKKNFYVGPLTKKYVVLFIAFLFVGNISMMLTREPSLINIKYMSYFQLFVYSLIIADGLRNYKNLWHGMNTLAIAGSIAGLTVIIQQLTGYQFANVETYRTVFATYQSDIIRSTGVFGDPNFAALNLNICLILQYCLLKKSRINKTYWLYLVLILITLAAIIITMSRSGYIALIFVALYILYAEKIKLKLLIIYMIIGFLFMSSIIFFEEFYNAILSRFIDINKIYIALLYPGQHIEGAGRIFYATEAFKMIAKNPVFGVGLGRFKEELKERTFEFAITHNVYLEIGAEQGLVGLGIIIYLIYSIYKALRLQLSVYLSREQDLISVYIRGALYVFLLSSLFLSALHEKILWIIISFILVMDRILFLNQSFKKMG